VSRPQGAAATHASPSGRELPTSRPPRWATLPSAGNAAGPGGSLVLGTGRFTQDSCSLSLPCPPGLLEAGRTEAVTFLVRSEGRESPLATQAVWPVKAQGTTVASAWLKWGGSIRGVRPHAAALRGDLGAPLPDSHRPGHPSPRTNPFPWAGASKLQPGRRWEGSFYRANYRAGLRTGNPRSLVPARVRGDSGSTGAAGLGTSPQASPRNSPWAGRREPSRLAGAAAVVSSLPAAPRRHAPCSRQGRRAGSCSRLGNASVSRAFIQ